jgi:superfamily II DNA helicase RecQ
MKSNKVTKVKTFLIRLHDSYRARDEAELNAFLATVKIKRLFSSLESMGQQGIAWSVLLFYEEAAAEAELPNESGQYDDWSKVVAPSEIQLTDAEMILYEELRKWRNARANSEGLKPFVICNNQTLKKIARARPQTADELRQIRGIGDWKMGRYGQEILAIVQGEIIGFRHEPDEDEG